MKYLDELRELKKEYSNSCRNEALTYVEKIVEHCLEGLREQAKVGKNYTTIYLNEVLDKSLKFDVLNSLSEPLRDELIKYGIKVKQGPTTWIGIFNYNEKCGYNFHIYWE